MIKVEFTIDGNQVGSTSDFALMAKKQSISIAANLDYITTLEDLPELNLNIELSEIGEEILWENLIEDKSICSILNEVKYFQGIRAEINLIRSKIQMSTFDSRHELNSLGNALIRVAQNMTDSIYFNNVEMARRELASAVKHTLGKEVEAVSNLRQSASQKSKNSEMNDAKNHLISDLEDLVRALNNPRLSSTKHIKAEV